MSLQLAAEHLKKYGRGEDTQLVHMTPGELKSMQAMAEAHGGSLTINPHTGLPEAGFLGDLFKIIAPMALMAIPGVGAAIGGLGASITGAATAGALESGLGMGLISGGLTALKTGDLGKGLTAGLGSGLMAGVGQSIFGGPKVGSNVSTPTVAEAASQTAPQAASNQGFTSMMQNPAVSGNVNVAGAQPVPPPTQSPGLMDRASTWWKDLSTPGKIAVGLGGAGILGSLSNETGSPQKLDPGMIRPYTYTPNKVTPDPNSKNGQPQQLYDAQGNPVLETSEKRYFNPVFTPETPIPAGQANSIPSRAKGGILQSYAQGGIAAFANGGLDAVGGINNTGPMGTMDGNRDFPGANLDTTQFATPSQSPSNFSPMSTGYEVQTDPYMGTPTNMATGGIAGYSLGGYAAGGNPRLLAGPGDGMSDNIPAVIGHKQPARLADGEFVVPADVVSHLGNGSTDAGAKRLYSMMDNVRAARTGSKKQGKQIKAEKYLPK